MAKAVEVTAATGGPLPARAANSADFSLPAADDVHLLAEVKLGDARCLAALFDRYGDDCIRVAHRLHPDARIAENVVFNAFMQLWRTPPDQPHSLKDWLLLRVR